MWSSIVDVHRFREQCTRERRRATYLKVWITIAKFVVIRRLLRALRSAKITSVEPLRRKGISVIALIMLLLMPFAARMARRKESARRVDGRPQSSSTLMQRRSDSSISAEEAHRMTAPAKKAPARKAAAKKAPAKKAPAKKA